MKRLSFTIVSLLSQFIHFAQTKDSCLPEGITFNTQEEMDSFAINYPNCTEVEGDVTIQGGGITNLNGLNVLTFIGGGLSVLSNDSLTSLTGLEGLTSIGGNLAVESNASLTSLIGLNNVTSVGGDVWIDHNYTLTSLTGLENVTSIGGGLNIYKNNALVSLTGLDNVAPGSIEYLSIYNNITLSNCAVESICEYLAAQAGNVSIHDNAPGCNSPEEVDSICNITMVTNHFNEHEISISPNPVNERTVLNLNAASPGSIDIRIFNTTGVCLKSWKPQNHQPGQVEFTLDLKDLPSGIYFCRVQAGAELYVKKFIKN